MGAFMVSLRRVQKLCDDSAEHGLLLTLQQQESLNNEVTRLKNFFELLEFCWKKNGQTFDSRLTKVLVEMFELLQDIWKPFTQETEEKWKELIMELKKSTTGLGISAAERDEIVKAMGSSGTS